MQAKQYEFMSLRYDDLKAHVHLPQFQRSLVWSDRQKSEFIRTVQEGKPFGCIMLYKRMESYEIIDGLQRFTTLRDYEDNPTKYLNIRVDNYIEIDEIIKLLQQDITHLSYDTLEKRVIEGIRKVISSVSLNDRRICLELRKEIVGCYNGAIQRETECLIEEKFYSLIEQWSKNIDFRELQIPTIVYMGDGADLPDIFYNLNTGGTKLSRYEVFASAWNTIQLKIDNEVYLDYIEDLYKRKTERTNLSITNYEEGIIKKTKTLSLYELCFALGKRIKESCKILFASYANTDDDEVDSIGFTSLATAIGLPLKKLDKLNVYINQATNIDNLMNVMDLIIKAYKKIEDILRNFISTVNGKKVFTKFIEAQILAILGTYLKLYFVIDQDLSVVPSNVSRTIKENFKRYMPFTYLYDILSEFWAGSGDRKLEEEMLKPIDENRYTSLIMKEKWNSLLYDWMGDQISKKSKNVSIENKLFLNFICKTKIDWHDNLVEYDIEHIIPKKRISAKKLDVAVSAIGNLCLLPSCDNRRKKEETVYEYLDRTSEITTINETKALSLYYPTRDELVFIRAGSAFSTDNYERFLKDRSNYLIREFLKLIE